MDGRVLFAFMGLAAAGLSRSLTWSRNQAIAGSRSD